MHQHFSHRIHFLAVPLSSLPFLRSRYRAGGAVTCIGLLLSLALLSSCGSSAAVFDPYLAEYGNLANLRETPGKPYIAGKIIAIDKAEMAVDELYHALPEGLRAKTPDEVGTVALIQCSESLYGTYTSGSKAYITKCEINLIDRKASAVVAREGFSSDKPPETKSLDGDWYGSRPTKQMVQFITEIKKAMTRTLSNTLNVYSVAFSPDGKTLASSGLGETVRLWDVASGKELRTLSGHSNNVNSVAFLPDGKTLASGSSDGTVKFWDVASGNELRTLTGDKLSAGTVAFSPDGKTLVSGLRGHGRYTCIGTPSMLTAWSMPSRCEVGAGAEVGVAVCGQGADVVAGTGGGAVCETPHADNAKTNNIRPIAFCRGDFP